MQTFIFFIKHTHTHTQHIYTHVFVAFKKIVTFDQINILIIFVTNYVFYKIFPL
jgi:hypothetical protein